MSRRKATWQGCWGAKPTVLLASLLSANKGIVRHDATVDSPKSQRPPN